MKTKKNFALIAGILLISFCTACALEEVKDNITIKFDSRGVKEIKPVTLERGKSLGKKYPKMNPIEGVEFKGWYDGFTECTKNTKIYVDVTLVAHWEDELVTVTFDSVGGTPDFAPLAVPKGSSLGVRFPINPRKKGFTLDKWSYNEDGVDTVLDKDTPITADITAVAQWKQATEYTVTFDTGTGASAIPSIKVFAGDSIDEWENRYSSLTPSYTAAVPPPATGRSFKEWVYDPTGQNIIYTGRTPVTRNITLVAQWRYTLDEATKGVDLSWCDDLPGDDCTLTVNGTEQAWKTKQNHPLLNYPIPTVTKNGDGDYVFTFSGKNSAIAIGTSDELRALLAVANSVTVEIDGTPTPEDRLFRVLIGNTITYGEGWNLTDNHKPDTMIPFEQFTTRTSISEGEEITIHGKDLVINEVNRGNKSDLVNYVVIQTNRDNSNQGIEQDTTLVIKSIKITVR